MILFMAYYHVHGLIPDGISQSEGYKMFEQYIASGAPMDNFDAVSYTHLTLPTIA